MKLLKIAWLLAIAGSSIFAGCRKDKPQEDILPPATQTGAGTFGCKINGKVYIPKGTSGTGTPNPKIQYDVDLNGNPYLSIETYQYPTNVNSGLIISFGYLTNIGFYSGLDSFRFAYGSLNTNMNCGISTLDTTIKVNGGGQITKLDISNRIISGLFDFTSLKSGCETVRITEGRFDIKF